MRRTSPCPARTAQVARKVGNVVHVHAQTNIHQNNCVCILYMYIHTHVFTHICTWMYMYIDQALTVKFTQMGVYIYNNNNSKYTLTHFGTTDLPENCCLCEAGSLHMHAVNISVAEPSRGPAMDGVSKNWLALVRLAGSLLIFAGYIYIHMCVGKRKNPCSNRGTYISK